MSIDKATGFAKTLRSTRTRLDDAVNLIRQAQTLSEITTPTNHIAQLGDRAYSVGTQIAGRASELDGHRTTPRINNLPPGRLTTPGGGHPGTTSPHITTRLQTTGGTGGPGSTIGTGSTTPTTPGPTNTGGQRGVSVKFIEANTTPPTTYAPTALRNPSFDPGQNPFGPTPTAFAVPHPGAFGKQPSTKPPAKPAPKTGWEAYAALPGGEFHGAGLAPTIAQRRKAAQSETDRLSEMASRDQISDNDQRIDNALRELRRIDSLGTPNFTINTYQGEFDGLPQGPTPRSAKTNQLAAELIDEFTQPNELAEQIWFGDFDDQTSRLQVFEAISDLLDDNTELEQQLNLLATNSHNAERTLAPADIPALDLTLNEFDQISNDADQLLADNTERILWIGNPWVDVNHLAYDIEQLAKADATDALLTKMLIQAQLSPKDQADLDRILGGRASFIENMQLVDAHPWQGAQGAAKGFVNDIGDLGEALADTVLRATSAGINLQNGNVHSSIGTPQPKGIGTYDLATALNAAADHDIRIFNMDDRAQQGGANMATVIELALVSKALVKGGLKLVKIGNRFFLKNTDNLIAITDDTASALGGNVFPGSADEMSDILGIKGIRTTTVQGTQRTRWYPNDRTRITMESHPDGLSPIDDLFNPRHHGEHFHVQVRPGPTTGWNNPTVSKVRPSGYTPSSGTGFLPGEDFPG